MSSFYSKEFKEAIANLPSKEKDKLILRLLKRDLPLINRLTYELLDNNSIEERRESLKDKLASGVAYMQRTNSVGQYLMEVRYLSGLINDHVFMTKDKFGQAYYSLWLVNEVLEQNSYLLNRATNFKVRKFNVYLIAKVYKILGWIQKLHEDFALEFEDELKRLGKLINSNPFMASLAAENELDITWLLSCEIPENIAQIEKEVRKVGGLK